MKRNSIIFSSVLLLALFLAGGTAYSQVQIDGNVYGGCNLGRVSENTNVTINGGTIGTAIPLADRAVDADGQQSAKINYGNVYGGGNGYEQKGTKKNKYDLIVPVFKANSGQVMGNTNITIGGNAVVRHAVFGGGNMGSVGTWDDDTTVFGISEATGKPTYCKANTGIATIVIKDYAMIGPKESDLTSDPTKIKEAFHYLGGNEGFVFGGSRGLSGGAFKHLSFVDKTKITIQDYAQAMNVFGGGDNGHIYTETDITIKDNAIIGGVPIHGANYVIPAGNYYYKAGTPTDLSIVGVDTTASELHEDLYGVGTRIFRGNVFGGGKGNDFISFWLEQANTQKYCYTAGRVYGYTKITIQDNAQVYNRVYGGGTIASVGDFITEDDPSDPDNHTVMGLVPRDITASIKGGDSYIYIKGGTIGSLGSQGKNCGEVFGGGRGLPGRPRNTLSGGGLESLSTLHQVVDEAYTGRTFVEITGGTVMSSVYGGAANGHVWGDTKIRIKDSVSDHHTVIGTPGIGGWHGNVYGGGGGTAQYLEPGGGYHHSITAGRVYGNTNVNIESGTIVHNVYGGGSLASVGTYLVQDGDKFYPYKSGGIATLNIIGGTIGTDGNENGMVYGSGRGEIDAPDATMDTLTYVAKTFVNIGVDNKDDTYGGTAIIKGSVYGSGENGHVFLDANVNIYGGTIGCTAAEYNAMSDDDKTNKFPYRGNVYGAGCGTDQYDTDNDNKGDTYNPMAGVVQGNTNVNIYGGYISRNVYGGGAMASVGTIDHTKTKPHLLSDTLTKASLSWPYELEYISIVDKDLNPVTTGLATVNIYGGHIGTHLAGPNESGCVFGSSRGDVGPLGVMDSIAIVRTTDVKIDFDYTNDPIDELTANCILGSVFGSGEDGTVYEDTKVTLTDGRISGSIFGGGSGTSTYSVALKNPNYPGSGTEYLAASDERSLTAGKVYGNTTIIINGGWVEHNIYGGGNMASVGKGNYIGYGEMASSAPTDPYENSGICNVTINGGTIGTTGLADANGVNNGYVFGASRGITFATVNKTPRYNYSRDFFLGYCNGTKVIIGDASLSYSPSIKGSVFGGGDNGHVRWHTKVTVNKGEIGAAYTSGVVNSNDWAYRGNVYGAGRGADKIPNSDDYCPSAGSVTLNTEVIVTGGTIHRNVYGGGSMASVGPPPSKDYNPGTSKCTVTINGGTIGQTITAYPDIYGGNIYGAGRGTIDEHFPLNMHATSNTTEVYIDKSDGIAIPGDVYGGGSYGQVKSDTKVYINNGTVKGSVYGAGMGEENTREAGQVLGNALVDMSAGTIERSIYGGGHVGSVGTFETYYTANEHNGNTFHLKDEPKTYKSGTGLTSVYIRGGQVGVITKAHMPDTRYPGDDEYGYVFAGGQGIADSINNSKANLLAVNCSTYFEMSGGLVTASVYGGAENGQVMGDTYVKIKGGQIGIGCYTTKDEDNNVVYNYDGIYTDPQWDAAITAVTADDAVKNGTLATYFSSSSYVFHECDHWPFGVDHDNDASTPLKYYTYDIYADKPNYNSEGGSVLPSDGHTFYGNVFGGGSGYYPFWSATENKSIWRRSAGRVCGNTRVDIEGGHILTSVYGGNEQTDVIGSCTVNMSGGTIGVPRTLAEITSHPVTCYLFGAGKGDQRILFNEWTNVKDVEVNISGGYIFGSVFGGGEDGHVLGNVVVNIKEGENGVKPFIGTWGTSYVDGNVFGGGRGFSGDALTAGAVCGNVNVNISAGTMLGSIYGGGRLASVGTYLAPTTIEDPEHPGSYIPHPNYGIMQPDNGADTHGHIVVNISGGIIGNTAPYVLFAGDDESVDDADKKPSNLGDSKYERLDDETVSVDTAAYILRHPISGNVFGGSMGRTHTIDGNISDIWPNLAKAKSTRVFISGDAVIRSSVYGGGEIGTVVEDAIVTISGGTIGTDIVPSTDNLKKKLRNYSNAVKYENFYVKPDNESDAPYPLSTYVSDHYRSGIAHYYFGSVFGGGYGSENVQTPDVDLTMNYTPELINNNAPVRSPEVDIAGRVYGNTYVYIKGGTIRGDVYGGGDIASVGTAVYDNSGNMLYYKANTGACSVVVSKETVDPVIGPIDFTSHNANVYAAGRGVGRDRTHKYDKYCNVNSSTLTVSGGRIWGCTFGGGADCHVLNNTQTNIQDGADIGDKGITEHDGCVFGGGRNYYNLNPTAGRVQGNAQVDVTGGRIRCSIFAGGSMARTGVDIEGNRFLTDSALHGNTIVNVSGTSTVIGAVENSVDNYIDSKYLVDCNYTIGDVYGGGKGDTRDTLDVEAGRVSNTFVNVTGSPLILGDIYGGGEMACVGYWDPHKTINGEPNPNHGKYYSQTGYTHVVVSGNPSIGTPFEFSIDNIFAGGNWSLVNAIGHLFHTCSGNVYGGSLGFIWPTHPNWVQMGRIRQSYVTFNGGHMLGNIFGGGSRGVVMEDTYVKVTGGTIGTKIDAYDTIPSYYYGSVFGGGYGNPSLLTDPPDMVRQFGNQASDSTVIVNDVPKYESCVPTGYAGRIYGNTHVEITGGRIMDCVFGGGDIASVGFVEKDANGIEIQNDRNKLHNGKCYVTVSGNAIVGPLDGTGHNAYVYGAGRGEVSDSTEKYKRYANVNETHVTIELTTNGAASKDSSDWKAADGGRIWGSIFGGGADSHVLGDAHVNMVSGVVGTKGTSSFDGNIFGGGRNFLNTNHTNGRVQGNIYITMTGGYLQGTIFGGGRLALSGVDVDGHFDQAKAAERGNVTIEVSGDSYIGTDNSRDLFWADESVGDIFGAGKGDTKNYDDIWAGRVTNSTIHVHDSYTYEDGHDGESDHIIDTHSPIIHGSVFGGGEMASLGWWDNDGKFIANTGEAIITIEGGVSIGTIDELTKYTKPTHEEEDLDSREWETAPFENPGDWTSYANDGTVFHTCTGNVFGGGQGDVNIACPHWVSMGRSYTSEVIIGDDDDDTRDPSIMGCVFGGGEQGSMLGDAHVTVYSGTIGTHVDSRDVDENTHVPEFIYGDVYGAGFGSYKTKLEARTYSYKVVDKFGNTNEVTEYAINDSTAARKTLSTTLGLTGADTLSSKPSSMAGRVYGNTRVDMLGGTVLGSVYGGGSYASVGYELSSSDDLGNTLVNIGLPDVNDPDDATKAVGSATIGQAVFGANNFSGTPYGNARVHIYKTAHTTGNELTRDALTLITGNNYPTGLKALKPDVAELTLEDIDDLTSAEMTSLKDDNRFAIKAVYGGGNNAAHTPVANNGTTLVHVHYCKENTICDLYGGGNAANTKNNSVIIDGGYFKRIFGGGNGSGTNNPANVIGTATTQINGGLFHEVYGGSNEKGTVGNIVLDIDEENDCDELIINGFGGNNEGTGGGGTITIGCGTKFYNFYAGANNATIQGNINVTIEGGVFQNFYGGNNQGGTITGDVTVNYRSGSIGNLYGGSNVGGDIKGKITVNVFFDETIVCPDGMNIDYVFGGGNMAFYKPTNLSKGALAPEVNIYKGIINYEVYGGGRGGVYNEEFMDAKVTGNPLVRIGPVWDDPKTNAVEQEYHEVVIGIDPETLENPSLPYNAETNKKYGYHSNNGNVFGGGNASPTQGNTKVYILNNSHVYGGVYGGGNNAIVTGNTDVIIGE